MVLGNWECAKVREGTWGNGDLVMVYLETNFFKKGKINPAQCLMFANMHGPLHSNKLSIYIYR